MAPRSFWGYLAAAIRLGFDGDTALLAAAHAGFTDIVVKLTQTGLVILDVTDEFGMTAYEIALRKGYGLMLPHVCPRD